MATIIANTKNGLFEYEDYSKTAQIIRNSELNQLRKAIRFFGEQYDVICYKYEFGDDKPEIVRYTDCGAESAIVLTANILASGRLCIEALTDSEDIVEICEDYILVGVDTITRQIIKENEINNNKQSQET